MIFRLRTSFPITKSTCVFESLLYKISLSLITLLTSHKITHISASLAWPESHHWLEQAVAVAWHSYVTNLAQNWSWLRSMLAAPGQCDHHQSHCVRIMQICVPTTSHTRYWEICIWDTGWTVSVPVVYCTCVITPVVMVTILSTMFYDKCYFHHQPVTTLAIIMFDEK